MFKTPAKLVAFLAALACAAVIGCGADADRTAERLDLLESDIRDLNSELAQTGRQVDLVAEQYGALFDSLAELRLEQARLSQRVRDLEEQDATAAVAAPALMPVGILSPGLTESDLTTRMLALQGVMPRFALLESPEYRMELVQQAQSCAADSPLAAGLPADLVGRAVRMEAERTNSDAHLVAMNLSYCAPAPTADLESALDGVDAALVRRLAACAMTVGPQPGLPARLMTPMTLAMLPESVRSAAVDAFCAGDGQR